MRACAYGECLRYWCFTTKCRSMVDDTTAAERMTAAALLLALALLSRSHRRAACCSAGVLLMALLCAPIYHARERYLSQLAPSALTLSKSLLPKARYSCRRATFERSCMSGGKLQVAVNHKDDDEPPRTMRLATNWMGTYKGLVLEPTGRHNLSTSATQPAANRRASDVQHADSGNESLNVLAAVPGDFGCRQPAHFLFNFIMPMWDALQQLEWADPARVVLYLDCTGLGPKLGGGTAGVEVEDAASFVHEAARVLSSSPLRSLPRLLYSSYATRTCFAGKVLVGMPCAVLDEYNLGMKHESIRAFRQSLMLAVLGRGGTGPARDLRSDRIVHVIDRHDHRRIVNAAEVLATIRTLPHVDKVASSVIYFEGLSLKRQMELALEANVFVGLDGSGFLNGFWMREPSSVVYILPFGNRYARGDQGANFFNLLKAVGVTVRQIFVDDPAASSMAADDPCMKCILSAKALWLKAGNTHDGSSAQRLSGRRLSTLAHRAASLWSTDRSCATLRADTYAAHGRRLTGTSQWDCATNVTPPFCIDAQDTTVTPSLMSAVTAAVRAAVVGVDKPTWAHDEHPWGHRSREHARSRSQSRASETQT